MKSTLLQCHGKMSKHISRTWWTLKNMNINMPDEALSLVGVYYAQVHIERCVDSYTDHTLTRYLINSIGEEL